MTRPLEDVLRVGELLGQGLSQAEAARRTGLPQATVTKWARIGIETVAVRRRQQERPCAPCDRLRGLDQAAYAYLLGLYLGDGCITAYRRGVFRLNITCCNDYPGIIGECTAAMESLMPNKVGRVIKKGCLDVVSYSKHWPCLFPQHGPGRKHWRPIVLEPWQEQIAMDRYPHRLLRGLVHSDGCRGINRVGGREYPRYSFSNRSEDIRGIFAAACDAVGVDCKRSNRWTMSVSRRADVATLDSFIGPKA